MSLIKSEKTSNIRAEIQFGITNEALDAEVKNVYKKNIGKLNVPGFRKGHAPLKVVEKMYGKGIFMDEALNNLLPAAYEEAIKATDFTVVSQPEFDVISMDDDGKVVLKATFDIKPEATVKEYKGLKAEREVTEVTDDMIDSEIKTAQMRAARELEITDRATEMDDIADIDFEGFVDGVAFEGGKGEHHKLKLGSGQFIPGFEEQVVGKNIGDEFDVNVKFPEDYNAKELAGKEAVFKCKLHAITREELPEIDDEFAKDMSFDTMDEYKADIRKKMEERFEKSADQILENKILDALLENTEVEVPESMYNNEVENEVREYEMNLRQNGLNLEQYFQYTGQNMDKLRENFRPRAERSVKVRLALEAVVKAENIVPSEEDVENEYKKLADTYKMEVEKIKEVVAAADISADIAVQKALACVKEAAVVTDKKPEEKTEENKDAE